jgi:hypothetical protein
MIEQQDVAFYYNCTNCTTALSEGGSSIWLYHEATHVIHEQV